MATALRPLTYEEWLRLPERADGREECVDGVIETMPPARWKHAVVVERLSRRLWQRLDERVVTVVTSNFGLLIRTEPLTQRTPDIAVFVNSEIVERNGYIHSAPALAIEVLSPANTPTRIRQVLSDYAFIRVPEVWVVDPDARNLAIHRLTGSAYDSDVLPGNAVTAPARFPSVQVDFSTIWP